MTKKTKMSRRYREANENKMSKDRERQSALALDEDINSGKSLLDSLAGICKKRGRQLANNH